MRARRAPKGGRADWGLEGVVCGVAFGVHGECRSMGSSSDKHACSLVSVLVARSYARTLPLGMYLLPGPSWVGLLWCCLVFSGNTSTLVLGAGAAAVAAASAVCE